MNIQLTDVGREAADQLRKSGNIAGLMECLTWDEQMRLAQTIDELEDMPDIIWYEDYADDQ